MLQLSAHPLLSVWLHYLKRVCVSQGGSFPSLPSIATKKSEELEFYEMLTPLISPPPYTHTKKKKQTKPSVNLGGVFFPPSNHQTNLNCGDKHKVEGNVPQIEDSLASHTLEQSHPASAER